MLAIEVRVVLATTIVVINPESIPRIGEVGRPAAGESARQHDINTGVGALAGVRDPEVGAAVRHEQVVELLIVGFDHQVEVVRPLIIQPKSEMNELLTLQVEILRVRRSGKVARGLVENARRCRESQARGYRVVEGNTR